MKAPYPRGERLVLTDMLVYDGIPTHVKYVKWCGRARSSLIIVELREGSRMGHRVTVHVNSVETDLHIKNTLALAELDLAQLLEVCEQMQVEPCVKGDVDRDDVLEALCDGYEDPSTEALADYDRRLDEVIQKVQANVNVLQ